MKFALKSLFASLLIAGAAAGQAAIVTIDEADFVAGPPTISFTEVDSAALIPSLALANVNGSVVFRSPQAGDTTFVSFGSYFLGQATGGSCGVGAAVAACISGSPTGPLTLDTSESRAFVTTDTKQGGAALSGTPTFNGAIAMLFGADQTAISFDAGFFNTIGSTQVRAYDRSGNLIELQGGGQLLNTIAGTEDAAGNVLTPGIQRFTFGSTAGDIAGVLISLVGPEPAGFSVDNLRFGTIRETTPPTCPGSPSCPVTDPQTPGGQVPEPSSLALVGLALVGLGASRRRRAG